MLVSTYDAIGGEFLDAIASLQFAHVGQGQYTGMVFENDKISVTFYI